MIKDKIIKAIQEAIGVNDVHLETPEIEGHGDYSSNVAMQLFGKVKNEKTPKQVGSSHVAKSERGDKDGLNSLPSLSKARSPRELAEKIVKKLKKDKQLTEAVEKIEVAGPGFINFFVSKKLLLSELEVIVKAGKTYGTSDKNKGKKVIVEYSSPNIAKPFTIGHLRSTIIGDVIANLLEATGWRVYRDNHLGDWGTQFGKQIYAIKFLGEGSKEGNYKKIESADNPVRELVRLYVEFHKKADDDELLLEKGREWFRKLEKEVKEAREIWQRCIEWSWKEFEKIYNLLGVEFSSEFNEGRGLGESFFEDKMKTVIGELENKGLLKEGKEGAKLVFFEDEKYPPAMIVKKDGTTLYHTRDLATDKYRKENYDPDLVINEVGSEQILYFQQLYEMEKMLGWFNEEQRVHMYHGLIRFKDKKMSTRKGDVVWLEDVLDEAKKRAYRLAAKSGIARAEWGQPEELISRKSKVDEELVSGKRDQDIKAVSIGAIKWNDLKRDPKSDMVFDWDEILNMEGNSGPYLQYTAARANSVLRKVPKLQNSKTPETNWKLEISGAWRFALGNWKFEKEELALLRSFIHFSEVVEEAAKNYAPNLVCNYLFDLAQKYNAFYARHKILIHNNERSESEALRDNKHGILEQKTKNSTSPRLRGASKEQSEFRIALTAATGQILKNGLYLLGIQSPRRM